MSIISGGLIRIFTFKAGVLARVAHDLRFTLGKFELSLESDKLSGRFWPNSLYLDGMVRSGRHEPEALSASDAAEILDNVRTQILHTPEYPEVRFEGRLVRRGPEYRVPGELELLGVHRPLDVVGRVQGERVLGEVEIQPSRWGIVPFKALLGAIKLQDRVLVRFELPLPTSES